MALQKWFKMGLFGANNRTGSTVSETKTARVPGSDRRELALTPERQIPMRTLADLRSGDFGRVVAVRGEPLLAIRILELGLVVGTPFRVLRTAPLGGPIELELEGSLLSLRRNEASAVQVEI